MGREVDFAEWFERATGHYPYAYQRSLADATPPPSVIHIPTGGGKTQALIAAWLHQRRAGSAPRRLVYALPMRSLVEQTVRVAHDIRQRLNLAPDVLPIHVLMGGEPTPKDDWRLRPEADQIIVGTIDMLLSRALNRGYAESRFAWPVAFGLLNSDCRWVFDEVQLMGPARATSAQLDGLRAAFGTALPCETVWVSATIDAGALETVDRPHLGDVWTLPEEDRSGPLATRLEATKRLERVDLTGIKDTDVPRAIAEHAFSSHVRGTRTLIVLNRVDRAQNAFRRLLELRGDPAELGVVLLHSRFRPPDRERHMQEMLGEPPPGGAIIVSTQVVEAGVDISSRTLLTETAPFSSIVQRLGRCNREGEHPEANVLWLDRGPLADGAAGRKAAAPYLPIDLEATRVALLDLEGSSLSPAALEGVEVPENADDPAVVRRRDLLDLFDTSPDLSGMDIDIAPFIRADDDRNVTVVFRDLGSDAPPRVPGTDEPEPRPVELVQVPRASLRDRVCWVADHLDGDWLGRRGRDVPPGATVMLSAADGGYDPEIGWDVRSKRAVDPVAAEEARPLQAFGSDTGTEARAAQELAEHLADVAREAAELANAIGLSRWREMLHAAGALHDVGKAHPVFQATIRKAIGVPEDDRRVWAKSGVRGGRHERRYFRHELASALAVSSLDGAIEVPQRDLTSYLVAAHHGRIRVSIRPAPGESRPPGVDERARFALGVADGDPLPEVGTPIGTIPATSLSLEGMELGAAPSWSDLVLRMRDDGDLGPFRLGFLEALLRVADWRASG
jgi:CRISPR-associated endonuclease/helicase Cas3